MFLILSNHDAPKRKKIQQNSKIEGHLPLDFFISSLTTLLRIFNW